MRGEIIAIGDELTSGRILNTTSSLAAAHLFGAGHELIAMTTIGDDPVHIGQTLKTALSRSEFILVTGGLGPTTDDLTNEAVAKALHRPTFLNQDLLKKIKEINSTQSSSSMLERLAWLPEGARVLNPDGEMAGHLLEHDGVPIFFLPGVPHEMEELLDDYVIPDLATRSTGKPAHIRQELYRVFGLSETDINQRCEHLAQSLPNLRLGYYPVYPEVHVSLFLAADDDTEADNLFEQADQAVRESLGSCLYGTGHRPMAEIVGEMLREKGLSLSVAESCTGGRLASMLTAVSGSSDFFLGGVVAYANTLKENMLNVAPTILAEHGAVSGQTAKAMAKGARLNTGSDIAVSITGIAGPAGGTPDKPVGTVCFGLATPHGVHDFRFHLHKKRWQIQSMAAEKALDLVRLHLLET